MSEKKSRVQIFAIILIVFVVIGIFVYYALIYNKNYTPPNNFSFSEEESLSGVTNYRDYLEANQEDKLNYYTLKIYDAFYDNIDEMKKGENIIYLKDYLSSGELNEVMDYIAVATSGALSCLFFDNPDLFWLSFEDMYIYTQTGGFTNSVTNISFEARDKYGNLTNFYDEEFDSESTINGYLSRMEQARDNIYQSMEESYPNGLNEYEMISYFNDYLVDNVEYDLNVETDLESPLVHTAYGALVNGVAVCDGYSYAMQYLLDGKGITNLVGAGYVIDEYGAQEGHMWSYVYLYDNWYALDVTWNDPVITDDYILENYLGFTKTEIYNFYNILIQQYKEEIERYKEEYKEENKHNYLLVGGDLENATGFYSEGRIPQNYIYYFDNGASYYQFPIPKISKSNFINPNFENIQTQTNEDGSITINIIVSGMQENYTLLYAKSSDGINYSEYVICDNVVTFKNIEDNGIYKFKLQAADGEVICEYNSTVTVEIKTSQNDLKLESEIKNDFINAESITKTDEENYISLNEDELVA